MNALRRGVLTALVVLITFVAPALPAQEAPAAEETQAERKREDALAKAVEEARELLREDKAMEAARLLSERAQELGKNSHADRLRFLAVQVAVQELLERGGNREEVEDLIGAFLREAVEQNKEPSYGLCGPAYLAIASYQLAAETLRAYLKEFPPPSQEELEEFRRSLSAAGYPEERISQAAHPRQEGRQYAEHLLDSLSVLGKQAPHFELTTLDGEKVSPGEFRGKVLLIDFWATGCKPCRDELPNVKRFYAEYHPRGLEILGLSLDRDREKLTAYVQQEEVAWAQVCLGDRFEEMENLYRFDGIPAMFLVDRQGILRARDLRGKVLEQEARRLVGQKAGEPDSVSPAEESVLSPPP